MNRQKKIRLFVYLSALVCLGGFIWLGIGLTNDFKVRCELQTLQEFRSIDEFNAVRDIPIRGQICVCERSAPRRVIVVAGRLNLNEFQSWLSQHPGDHYVESTYDLRDADPWGSMMQACVLSTDLPSEFAETGHYLISWSLNSEQGWNYMLDVNANHGIFRLVAVPSESP